MIIRRYLLSKENGGFCNAENNSMYVHEKIFHYDGNINSYLDIYNPIITKLSPA